MWNKNLWLNHPSFKAIFLSVYRTNRSTRLNGNSEITSGTGTRLLFLLDDIQEPLQTLGLNEKEGYTYGSRLSARSLGRTGQTKYLNYKIIINCCLSREPSLSHYSKSWNKHSHQDMEIPFGCSERKDYVASVIWLQSLRFELFLLRHEGRQQNNNMLRR